MSRKWNLFKKKAHKTDSHGTTLANEEIIFQSAVGPGGQWGTPNNAAKADHNVKAFAPKEGKKEQNANVSSNKEVKPAVQSNQPSNHDEASRADSQNVRKSDPSKSHQHTFKNHVSADQTPKPPLLVTQAIIPKVSPRIQKKLIKPGGANNQTTSYIVPNANNTKPVSITAEYTDPFDAVAPRKSKDEQSTTDGYVEPYEAQQLCHGVAQNEKKKTYDDPWDKPAQRTGDYEEPWDHAETLPYQVKRPSQPLLHQLSKASGDGLAEYPVPHSGESSASSSSASLAKQRMVRVESPRHSPHASPRVSPKLDHRLIRPKEADATMHPLYHCGPSGAAKYDRRLIKAEPSLDEIRRSSPIANRTNSSKGSSRTNSPGGSSHVSPNHSPLGTLASHEAIQRLNSDQSRRASSPLVQPMNPSHYMLNKAKSRSLDVRNPMFHQQHRGFPKSASEDQLIHAALNMPSYRNNLPLRGVTEYDEPWDGGDVNHMMSSAANIPLNIVHSRSRSYDLNYVPPTSSVNHEKSRSFDKQEKHPRNGDYDQPWDKKEVPQTHLESMHRFKQQQLELHPSEAVSHGDFDPMMSLHKQCWFHGRITRDQAHVRLLKEEEGTYLVRNSESNPKNFSLSLRTRDDIIHMVISSTRDGFWILGEFSAPFHSVPEMIAFYAAHRLKISDTQQISLKYPLPEEYL